MHERRAFLCTHEDHVKEKCARRIFLLPGELEPPKCPDHPGRKMISQPNVKYNAKTGGKVPTRQ